MSAEATEEEATMLREELALLRAELAAIRADQETWAEKEARLRAARDRAAKAAGVLSQALAERIRIDAATPSRSRRLLARSTDGPTGEEAQQLELIRASGFFDPAWYLRHYLDVVRSGEEPTLHFLRHPVHPFRQPGPAFDTARYYDDHPEVLEEGINPLVHFLLSPESAGADRYPPEA